ncbi:MAG: beta-N-acetylhexosaminidase [Parvibaculaceae bacterium]|nr:beta-N-acetylhexosaminidase [Parvibaculaceae bacterium]
MSGTGTTAAIYGCLGTSLSAEEKAFFARTQPWGFILFLRNCESPEQIGALSASLRDCVGRDAPILIDQEGGRVQRLRPPHWPLYPAGRRYGDLYAMDREQGLEAARLGARLMAHDLKALGIDVDCLPVLDVPVPGAHDVIGNRAYGLTPEPVVALARAAADGLLEGGVLPVAKHIPGHGRAGVDSHLHLPVVEASAGELRATDFPPFRALNDLPLAMTAHVVYTAFDAAAPATTSRKVVQEIIRAEIGFGNCLMSDDLSMQALSGTLGERAGASLAAGCDLVLHCNGKMEEMIEVSARVPVLSGEAAVRANRALGARRAPGPLDVEAARARFAELIPVIA